jgi:predicted CXXCH cytochrome family protein
MLEAIIKRPCFLELSQKPRGLTKTILKRAFIIFFAVILFTPTGAAAPKKSQPVSLGIAVSKNIAMPLWHNSVSPAFMSTIAINPQNSIKLHHFDLPCNTCHDPANASPQRVEQAPNIWKASADINQGCTQPACHEYDTILNHPINVMATGAPSSDLPLENERITCLTCHSEQPSAFENDPPEDTEPLLRIPDSMDLCDSCHSQMTGTMRQQSHWNSSTKAHLASINPQSTSHKQAGQSIDGIDAESRTCLSCHEDVTVTIPAFYETPAEKTARWAQMTDHPIGMDYQRVALRRGSYLRFPLTNPKQIRFFDGKVGCGSCHSPYADRHANLVQGNSRSQLCRRCHNR